MIYLFVISRFLCFSLKQINTVLFWNVILTKLSFYWCVLRIQMVSRSLSNSTISTVRVCTLSDFFFNDMESITCVSQLFDKSCKFQNNLLLSRKAIRIWNNLQFSCQFNVLPVVTWKILINLTWKSVLKNMIYLRWSRDWWK